MSKNENVTSKSSEMQQNQCSKWNTQLKACEASDKSANQQHNFTPEGTKKRSNSPSQENEMVMTRSHPSKIKPNQNIGFSKDERKNWQAVS